MKTRKVDLNELKQIIKQIIKEEESNLRPIEKIKINGEPFDVFHIHNNGFENHIYLVDEFGDLYIDVNKEFSDNPLLNAVWVEQGGEEERIADRLNILNKTGNTTKSGFNTYIMYKVNSI